MPARSSWRRRGPHLAGCAVALLLAAAPTWALADQSHSADLDSMIERAAKRHGIPESLVRRVVQRESRYNPRARNHKYWGLMQISYPTARSMGFKGTPEELLNPVTNLTYAVPYLANAFIAAGKREDAAVRLYARGYYDAARRRGLLGVMRTADSTPMAGFHEEVAAPPPPQNYGIFGTLFGSSEPAPAAAQPQLAGAADAQAPEPAPATVAAPPPAAGAAQVAGVPARGGRDSTGDVAMVADKTGRVEPPKGWRRDGGVTVMARGEQSATQVAAVAGEHDEAGRHRRGRSPHKVTTFAALDVPASAQAYAEGATPPPAPSQAAIEQAVSQTAPAGAQASADPATPQPQAAASPEPARAHASGPRHRRAYRLASKHTTLAAKVAGKSVADLRP